MKFFVLLLFFSLVTSELSAQENGRFWASDKVLHFGVSMGLSSGGYILIRKLGDDNQEVALMLATTVALLPGFAKEFLDSENPDNHFSNEDIIANFAGATLGSVLCWAIDSMLTSTSAKDSSLEVYATGSGIAFRF